MKILVGDFNAKVRSEGTLKPNIGNESLHEISSVIGIEVINFATRKLNCHKYNVPILQHS
jgi:hypothetical protein